MGHSIRKTAAPSDGASRTNGSWWDAHKLRWLALVRSREEQVFLVLTLVIGALVGLTVVAFIIVSERFGARLYPAGGEAWRRLAIPVGGSLAIGYLLCKYFPEARGSGVPQTKAALYIKGGRIPFSTVFGKFFCTSASLATGIPLGREGPAVQVGAGIASVLGRKLGLRPEKVKSLIPVGAAAAIAAAFNTPLAAVLFSLEEVVGDLHAPVLGSVVLASATSWGVLRLMLGNNPLFHAPQYQIMHAGELAIYAVLGAAGGFISAGFTRLLSATRRTFLRLPKETMWLQPLAGGLAVGVMGWFVPQTLGVGYAHVGEALNGHMVLKLILLLLVLKFVAVVVCYASGNAGGIFGPSLFIGAMLGGVIGTVAQRLFPGYVAAPGAYALVGMGTAFAGIIRAPMTSVVMIFETTRDYAVIVPLMISNLVSFFIASRLQKDAIYEVLAEQDGIHLPSASSRGAEPKKRVADAMKPAVEIWNAQITVADAALRALASEWNAWPVADEHGLRAILRRSDLQAWRSEGREAQTLRDLLPTGGYPRIFADQTLHVALEKMGCAHADVLPVVSRANARRIEGVVTLRDVLKAYGVERSSSTEPESGLESATAATTETST